MINMTNKIDTIIFISNPFGFGPAGKTVILMEELRKKYFGKIVYIASQKCLDILPKTLRNTIEVIETDERDTEKIVDILSYFKPAMAVVVLNKAAIKTTRGLGIKTFFVDSLSWIWKEIPNEYLSADIYYYYDIFGEQKRLSNMDNARPISPILGILPERKMVSGHFLIYMGGFSNPFVEDNFGYLQLLANLLNHVDSRYKITVTGGKSGIDFLARISGKNKNIKFIVVERNFFLEEIAQAERFITTSGSTAVFEAFAIGTPTSFLPPTNLSQWKQLKFFLSLHSAPLEMQWERYFTILENLDTISEQDVIREFSFLPEIVIKNENIMNHMKKDFRNLFSQEADFSGQRGLISKTDDGASEIISDILKVINHSGR